MFKVLRSGVMQTHQLLLVGFLTILLTGCQNAQDSLYNTAIDFERSRAGLELVQSSAGDIDFSMLQGGNAEGETILMIHGFGADKDNWVRLAGELGDTYRIVAVDLAGHGESSQTKSNKGAELDFLVTSQADRLNTLLDTLDIDKVHYMGNSMGGAIGLAFAVAHPERLKSLTLLDNAGIDSPKKSEYFQLLDKGENPLIAREPGDYAVLIDFVMSEKPFIPWPITAVMERKAIARKEMNDKVFADLMASQEQMGSSDYVNKMLASIETPSLVIWGEEDRVLDVSSIEVMEKYMPNLESVILPGIGHVPMVEAPDQVGDAFRKFTSRL
ncbi:alpha/beta fold hydrolase [Parendozoicomonas sp. Alg238-R29]|uniref:alpha/beta fold hydrolase n=1 Tax=Parendozoicomonas sp. Alg238-R29 TaxID=2993446 RepID=UPI00248E3F96|nr:alpha/beta fold hydrolase [Parendozoicomonas sp. Alg238-R29]